MGTFIYTLYVLTTLIILWVCVKSFQHREKLAGAYLFVWMLNALVWSVGVLICSNPRTPIAVIEFLMPVRMTTIVFQPLVMLFLALEYTESKRLLTRTRIGALLLIPACSLVLLFGPWTDLFVLCQPTLLSFGLYNTRFGHGPWFLVHSAYSTLVVLAAGVTLVNHWRYSTGFYRRQAALLLTGYTLPVAAMIFMAFGPDAAPKLDWALLVFPITAACWYVAVNRYKLFDVTPITRRRAVELMSDAVIVLNADHQVTDLNQSALELVGGAPHEDLLGVPLAELLPEHHAELEPVFTGAQTGVTLDLASGRRVYDVSYTVLATERRRSIRSGGGMLVFRDATEKAMLIEELDAYARTVAHDLKNPLSGLHGYLEVLEEDLHEGRPTEDMLDVVHRAQGVTDRMIELVNELLLMARLRSDADIPLEVVDMAQTLDHVRLRMSAQLEGVTLTTPNAWPGVRGYAPWLQEVWVNYLSNAIKYGGDPPTVTLRVDEDEPGMARFWVEDNGLGMTPEQAATVFDEFTRLEQHQSVGGHGVGLSIVQRIITRLGGSVGVECAPGQGARFWFTLPRTS